MQIQVRLAEPFWRAVGQRNLTVDLAEGSRVKDLIHSLCEDCPALVQELADAPPQIFIEEDEATAETQLFAGNRVYLVWAIAGG
ncbi:MAG: hypothetical protein GY803_08395 [Chloroflexi bacterium]|nr:hypothetical protein [Chloroflexota bacterium]